MQKGKFKQKICHLNTLLVIIQNDYDLPSTTENQNELKLLRSRPYKKMNTITN